MQKEKLNALQIQDSNGIVRNVSNKANYHYFTCDSEAKVEDLPSIPKVEVLDLNTQISGKNFNEGDLMIIGVNFGVDVYAKINNKGELIIFSKNAEKYSINNNGDLIYTYCNE